MSEVSRQAANREPDPSPARPGIDHYLLAMSHELRAPLNTVIGMASLLLDGDLPAPQRRYVNGIHAAGEGLAAILNDVLDLTRALTNRLVLEPIPFDLKSMVEETASALTDQAAARNLALRVDWRPELPRQVRGDPGRIRQILANFIGYALNSTTQGEVVVRVTSEGDQAGRPMIRFSVEDTGSGLALDRLEQVFEAYVPVDPAAYRSFGITGLGLRLSAELVSCLHGHIGVETQLGQGSRLWFSLPMPEVDRPPGLPALGPTRGGRVLLVEADPAARARSVAEVTAMGWEIDCVEDANRAVRRLEEAAAAGNGYRACVFSDYAVRPSHAELASRLKADDRLASVALVILTAVGSPGEAKRLWHAGFAGYLRKPLPRQEFRDTLAALEAVGPDGRAPAMITRHSLAETRNRGGIEPDGVDAILAGLAAPAAPTALLVGMSGPEQISVTEALAHAGLIVAPASATDAALARIGREQYDLVVFDADRLGESAFTLIRALRPRTTDSDRASRLVAISVDPALRLRLADARVDHFLTKPVRPADLGPVVAGLERAELESGPLPDDSAPALAAVTEIPAPHVGTVLVPTDATTIELAPPLDDRDPVETASARDSSQDPLVTLDEDRRASAEVADSIRDAEVEQLDTVDREAMNADPSDPFSVEGFEANGMAIVSDPILVEGVDVSPVGEPTGTELPSYEPLSRLDDMVSDQPAATTNGTQADELAPVDGVTEAVLLEASEIGAANEDPAPQAELTGPPASIEPSLEDPEPWYLVEPLHPGAAPEPASDEDPAPAGELLPFTPEPPDLSQTERDRSPDDDPGPATGPLEALALDEPANPVSEAADLSELAPASPAEDEPEVIEARSEPDALRIPLLPPDEPLSRTEPIFFAPIDSSPPIVLAPPEPEPEPAEAESESLAPVEVAVALDGDDEVAGLPVHHEMLVQVTQGGGFGLQHLIASFFQEAPARLADLAAALGTGDDDGARTAVRGIKQLAGWVRAERLLALGDRFEAHLAGGERDRAARTLGEIGRAFAEARRAIEETAPPALLAAADLPVVNRSFLDQLAPGRDGAARALAARVVGSFRSDAPGRLADLRQAIDRQDGEAAQRVAQTLKAMCGLIGADSMAKLCALVEADARLKRIAQSRRYLEQLTLEFDRVIRVVEAQRM